MTNDISGLYYMGPLPELSSHSIIINGRPGSVMIFDPKCFNYKKIRCACVDFEIWFIWEDLAQLFDNRIKPKDIECYLNEENYCIADLLDSNNQKTNTVLCLDIYGVHSLIPCLIDKEKIGLISWLEEDVSNAIYMYIGYLNGYRDTIKSLSDLFNDFLNKVNQQDIDDAIKLKNKILFESNINSLSVMLSYTIMSGIHKITEQDVYVVFKEKYKKILGNNCSIINVKNDPHHIPDFWVEINSEKIPVECKLYNFNKKAMDQLNRYMNVYNCKHGIAVGSKCTVKLPENIRFISIDELKSV